MRGLKRYGTRFYGMALAMIGATAAQFAPAPKAYAQVAPVIQCQGRPVTALSFSAPTLESGTALQTGAIYRFSNVATGVDARVEITGFVNGGTLSIIDRDTGLVNYFQPELQTSASGTGAADFNISFVQSGTTIPVALDIAASSIDVDGNNVQLREYVEYEDTSVGYVLSSTTELDRNASGPTPGRNRYESRTPTVAPGIDPTAQNNIVTVFYTDVTNFDFRVGTLGSGNMTRLTSQGYDCPNLGTPVPTSEVDEDFGDALLNNYGNPIHTIVPGVRLGASNTVEAASGNSATANGDAGDDGVSLPNFVRGQTANASVIVSGAGGYLQGWIDWNDDGDVLDAGEQIASNVQDMDNDGFIALNIPVPVSANLGDTIGRFRWSTAVDLGYQEAALDGEVEDYQITIEDPPPPTPVCPTAGQNIALTGIVTQSSTGFGGVASRAIDGNTNGVYNAGSVTHTNTESAPWWGLDLGTSRQIDTIDVWNRTDCCSNRLDNFHLFTSASPFPNTGDNEADLIAILNDPAVFKYQHNGAAGATTTIPVVNTDRYVRVQLPFGNRILSLAEVEVNSCMANITGVKDVEVYDPANTGLYALPGNDVIYTITATNSGVGSTDNNSIELIDRLPPEIEIWNGDIDDGGPETDPVSFSQTGGAGLTFNYATDVRFGTGPTKPADFDSCTTIAPDSSYRPDLTFICFNPKGAMAAGDPDPSFSVDFRARIK